MNDISAMPAQDIAGTSEPKLLVLSSTRVALNSWPQFAKLLLGA